MELTCPWEAAKYFIFSSNVPTLLYYSHFVAIFAAIIFAMALFGQRKENLSVKLFLSTIFLFTAWTVIDVLLWASNSPDLVLFYWSLQILLEILIYGMSFYFAYVFITKRDLPFSVKVAAIATMLPVVVLLPTSAFLPGIDVSYCNAVETNLVIAYTYVFEIIVSLFILGFAFRQMHISQERFKEISYFLGGIIIFLIAFSSGNIIGSLTENWALAQVGLFGMPVFIAFLAYSVVRFKSFNVKLISTQVIVTTLWALTLAILFIRKIENVRYVVAFTLVLFTILGYQLIKSVKREIQARELIQRQKEQLESANMRLKELDKQKTEFVSFATHQLRSPLASMKGYASLILDGDLGKMDDKVRDAVKTVFASASTLSNVVDDYLNISRIELGTMKYDMKKIDFKDLLKGVIAEQKPNIEAKGLVFIESLNQQDTYMVNVDPDKFKQVLMNIVDNSIKYTPSGSLTLSLVKKSDTVVFEVSDTGVGIDPRVMPKLFQKFSRAPDASEVNIHGTGLGLFIARQIIEAHGGRIWAESAGAGKGAQFYVEIPKAN